MDLRFFDLGQEVLGFDRRLSVELLIYELNLTKSLQCNLAYITIKERFNMKEVGILEKIRIQNVRSLKDTGEVRLSPITLLVGENSSGKSTFLRTFPLLKQSICKRTNGPVLWAGDVDDYVDFGSFQETVTNDGSHDIIFSFKFLADILKKSRASIYYMEWPQALSAVESMFPEQDEVCYSITISPVDLQEQTTAVEINLNHARFKFILSKELGQDEVTVDNQRVPLKNGDRRNVPWRYGQGIAHSNLFEYTLPPIHGLYEEMQQLFLGADTDRKMMDGDEEESRYTVLGYNYERDMLHTLLRTVGRCLCAGVSWTNIRNNTNRDFRGDSEDRSMWNNFVRTMDRIKHEDKKELLAKIKLAYFYDAFSIIEKYLEIYFRHIHYIAPLRATAERYYRLRNLAIDEVDYQGKNLAIFLNSLSDEQMKKFQKWTQEKFGFQIIMDKSEGHISLRVSLKGQSTSVNISDTGFGYSQILPIITQLWDLSVRPGTSKNNVIPLVIAIEQPELHLHPALQAKLTNAFMACIESAKQNGRRLQLLIETHSETIINCFGRAIAQKRIASDDVSVVLFEKKEFSRTAVRISEFDKDGYLQNWPVGFFAPGE